MRNNNTIKWSHPYWNFFHTLAMKVKEESLKEHKIIINDIIVNLFSIIPCATCKSDSLNYINRIRTINLNSKYELIMFFFNFHNYVNRKVGNRVYKVDILQKYSDSRYDFPELFLQICDYFSSTGKNIKHKNDIYNFLKSISH